MVRLNAYIFMPYLRRFKRVFWRKMDVEKENSTFIN
jgi:hypothetical protein